MYGMTDSQRLPPHSSSDYASTRLAYVPIYIWAFMNSNAMKCHLFSLARGAIGQAIINAKEVQSLELPLPPLSQERQFAEIVEAVRSMAPLAESSYKVALVLNALLMSRLLGAGA